jgi:hypothetical protein
VLDRATVETHRIRSAQQARRARDRPRGADADGAAVAELALGGGDELRNRAQRRTVIVLRRRDAPTQELASLPVEGNDLDLGPAEIDPEAKVDHDLRCAPVLRPNARHADIAGTSAPRQFAIVAVCQSLPGEADMETIMGKYVVAWLLGVPAFVLVIVYMFAH